MTLSQSGLLELTQVLRTADGGDVMRQMLGYMLQALVDAEATSVVGAAPHERTEERTNHRNGTRPKTISTTAGDLTVKIPKLRTGSFFPTLLEPRRRVDVALHAVIMEAYVHGVSTPYVFLDATYCKARLGGRVVSQAVVIATGVSADGRREVLSSQVGESESKAFWTEFLRGLRERGLAGAQL